MTPVSRVELSPIGEKPRPAVIEQSGESYAAVPVRGEVVDARFRQDGLLLYTQKRFNQLIASDCNVKRENRLP